jgi:hypothetical protein
MKKDFDLALRIRGGHMGREPVLQEQGMAYYYQTRNQFLRYQDPRTLEMPQILKNQNGSKNNEGS